jgi:hypothetical protein
MGMSVSIIIEFAVVAIAAITGICVVYVMFEMRKLYNQQREQIARAILSVEESQKIQQEFTSLLRHIESDGHALQKIAVQIEEAVAVLRESIGTAMNAATERQAAAIESLRDHADIQEERMATMIETISEALRDLRVVGQTPPAPRQPQQETSQSRLRRAALSQDPELRFSVLKDWVSNNSIGILHRASRGWNSVNDLIANIPSYLNPEAEVAQGSVLLVGTRGHSETLAIPLRQLDPSSDFSKWFDPVSEEQTTPIPAVLVRSGGQLTLLAKGTN